MPVLLKDEELATSRFADERDPSSQTANNTLITAAFSQGNVNGHGLEQNLNEIDYEFKSREKKIC